MSERAVDAKHEKYTAVVDIGKTSSRLLLVNDDGDVCREFSQPSSSSLSELGYEALNSAACEAWLRSALIGLGEKARGLQRVIVTTHGAAVAALRDGALAMPIPDYESEVFDDRSPHISQEVDCFSATLSPVLPRGLNMGLQLDWLNRHARKTFAPVDTLMPYAQYWAWWLSGIKSSEVSSLGCHTLLWNPDRRNFSSWAMTKGWAARFAPVRRAWEVLGLIRPALADSLGLPRNVQIHVGVHDSNACLARYLREWPRMTLVSSGTWTVILSPGAMSRTLRSQLDQLGNVSVRGETVPTARFMGGREMTRLCAGADPSIADPERIAGLLGRGLRIRPCFEEQGGAFAGHAGEIRLDGRMLSVEEWQRDVDPVSRATAASLYVAQMTAWTIRELGGLGPVVVDGPLARNRASLVALAALLRDVELYVSRDPLEGTARGAWMLTRWTSPLSFSPAVERIRCDGALATAITADWSRWTSDLPVLDTTSVGGAIAAR